MAPPAAAGLHTAGGARAVVAASVGNMLEWYDFSVFALFAIYVGENFFPSGERVVQALLVFGLGYVARPLGAILLGLYGDRAGRKAALTATILIMACGTALIALTPTYEIIGTGATVILLAGRLLQGFSTGGEIGGATAFLVEHAPKAKQGLFTAWLQASMGMSKILGALVAFSVTSLLAPAAVTSWGWRIPFLLGMLIAPVGWYLRRTLDETPDFTAELERRRRESEAPYPLTHVFRNHWRSLLIGTGLSVLWAAAVSVLLISMPVFAQRALGFSASDAFAASVIGNTVFAFGCFAFGGLSDRIGDRRTLLIGAVLLALGVVPLFLWLDISRSLATLLLVESAFGVMVSSYTGVAPKALSSLFPTSVRIIGVSVVYNTAYTLFGAFAPATVLAAGTSGSVLVPAWYVLCAAVPAVLALLLWGRGADQVSGAAAVVVAAAGRRV